MKRPVLFLALVCAIVISSCKKDSSADTSKIELLTQKPWLIEKVEYKDGNEPWESENPDPCDLDNTWKFEKDNTIMLDHGPLKCNPADPQQASSMWSFADDEKSIILNLDGEQKFSFETFTPDRMVLLNSEVEDDGLTYLFKVTFKR